MLISKDWIQDFVELESNINANEFASKFTMTVAEVESFKILNDFWKKMYVAEILDIIPHPAADKLNLVTFCHGKSKSTVVCGASNVKVGMKTAYAPVGTTLPSGFTLQPKKIRGILSEGMLCSKEELGLETSSSGIIEFEANVVVGTRLSEFYDKKDDLVLEIDNKSITHRPDLWGQFGMAREIAALFKTSLKNPYNDDWKDRVEQNFNDTPNPLDVDIQGESAAINYYGISVDNIEIKESPKWMITRLETLGIRAINNIVDISNYVMLELGHPLHIFDRSKIDGNKIIIKRLASTTKFKTLDGIERMLDTSTTMVGDKDKPLVIAGIMGGEDSSISKSTTQIFIEVANWKSSEIRKTSSKIGLRTDSSQRFEKTLDSKQCYMTLMRTLDLILKLSPNAKIIGRPVYDGIELDCIKELIIDFDLNKANKVLGTNLSTDEACEILRRLDFKFLKNDKKNVLKVLVPSFRATKDISCDADLIEELGRFIGYDNISPQSPILSIAPVRKSFKHLFQDKIRNFMVYNASSHEVMTSPMVSKDDYVRANFATKNLLHIINALSKDAEYMRNHLLPSVLKSAQLNSKNFDNFKLFELGRIYIKDNKNFSQEREQLIFMQYDKDRSVFIDSLNMANRLMNELNLSYKIQDKGSKFKSLVIDEYWNYLHPHEFKNFFIMGKLNASIFSVHPYLLKKLKIKGHITIFILDYSDFISRRLSDKIKYNPIVKTPSVNFDYTITLLRQSSAIDILNIINKIKNTHIKESKILDIFYDSKEYKYITIRSIFENKNKTLDSKTIKECEEEIIYHLKKNNLRLKES